MEERPLRKISSEGTAVRSPPRVFLFRRELIRENYFAKMFDGNIPTFGRVLPINATSTRKAVAASLLSEEERSLGNWSYDVTA